MSASQLSQRMSTDASSPPLDWHPSDGGHSERNPNRTSRYWMILDGLTVAGAATVVTIFERHVGPVTAVKSFWHGTLIQGESMGLLLTMLLGFVAALIETSRRMHLYDPSRLGGFLHEQRLTVQACAISGLLLAGALYLLHASAIPRSMVMITLGLVMVSLSFRRLVYRSQMYQRFERDTGTRNVLIVGTGRDAQELRQHFSKVRHLGYRFKGFIEVPESDSRSQVVSKDVVGGLETLFEYARKHFVDEIFIAGPCESGIVCDICQKARIQGVDLRVIPNMYDGLAWNRQIEYIGQFPTITLHRGHVPELALVTKRILDVLISSAILIVLLPIMLVIVIAIKLDSAGPVLYISERIGKKGQVFGCIKFRTMVRNAESLRANILSMNERSGVLFKIKNDPRVTKVGRILRKYSLDELPQFINVLRGHMSIVGPRPPIASEVRDYKLKHLRRLDVTPGITGLWQVQGRQNPEFDSYIMLDLAYIETWSVWLDVKIIVRTIGVVFAGTGS